MHTILFAHKKYVEKIENINKPHKITKKKKWKIKIKLLLQKKYIFLFYFLFFISNMPAD